MDVRFNQISPETLWNYITAAMLIGSLRSSFGVRKSTFGSTLYTVDDGFTCESFACCMCDIALCAERESNPQNF